MEQSLNLNIAGEEFIFDYRRAIYWPEKKILLAADLHWGKTHFLRKHGVAISDNVFDADLQRLSSLLTDYEVETFLVLGDLIHHEKSLGLGLIRKITQFRDLHPCELVLLKGNHDRYTEFPESWGIIEEKSFVIGDFSFHHEHQIKDKRFQFSGHLHPTVKIRSGHDSLRLPSFILGENYCYLPAFSYLTGGQDIRFDKSKKAIVIAEDGLLLF